MNGTDRRECLPDGVDEVDGMEVEIRLYFPLRRSLSLDRWTP